MAAGCSSQGCQTDLNLLWGACKWIHIGRGAGQGLGHSACVATLQTLLDEVGGLLLIAAEDGRSNLCLQALEVEAQAAKVKAIQQAALVVGEATEALLQAAPACRVALLVSESHLLYQARFPPLLPSLDR